jgi:hypothetical protein
MWLHHNVDGFERLRKGRFGGKGFVVNFVVVLKFRAKPKL